MRGALYLVFCGALGLAVWYDARRAGVQGLPGGRDGTFNAVTWGVFTALAPLVVVVYLWRRTVHVRRNRAERDRRAH